MQEKIVKNVIFTLLLVDLCSTQNSIAGDETPAVDVTAEMQGIDGEVVLRMV